MPTNRRVDLKKLTVWALICALSYVVVALIQIPVFPAAPFLELEFKDAVLMIGAFIYGPVAGCLMSVAVALLELVTISNTGLIGAAMNIVSSCAFVVPAALVYRKHRTIKGAVGGLCVGGACMVAAMLLWNALITPLYMGAPREVVMGMLLPVFLPFNLLKGVMNGALVLLLYKYVVTQLRKARLLPSSDGQTAPAHKHRTLAVTLISLGVLATATLIILVLQGVI